MIKSAALSFKGKTKPRNIAAVQTGETDEQKLDNHADSDFNAYRIWLYGRRELFSNRMYTWNYPMRWHHAYNVRQWGMAPW